LALSRLGSSPDTIACMRPELPNAALQLTGRPALRLCAWRATYRLDGSRRLDERARG